MKKTKETYITIVNVFIKCIDFIFNKSTNDTELTANAITEAIFKYRSTSEAIDLINAIKQKSDAELTKRKTLAILEKNSVDFYFKKENKAEGKTIKIDYQIINNYKL